MQQMPKARRHRSRHGSAGIIQLEGIALREAVDNMLFIRIVCAFISNRRYSHRAH